MKDINDSNTVLNLITTIPLLLILLEHRLSLSLGDIGYILVNLFRLLITS